MRADKAEFPVLIVYIIQGVRGHFGENILRFTSAFRSDENVSLFSIEKYFEKPSCYRWNVPNALKQILDFHHSPSHRVKAADFLLFPGKFPWLNSNSLPAAMWPPLITTRAFGWTNPLSSKSMSNKSFHLKSDLDRTG